MDNYAKGVLTVIAATLILISFQLSKTNIIKNAYAKGDCGDARYNACYVKIVD
tara:strand:+ start:1385 stop:1543 length:159 start_codon:yes stop_codon:yes gene_type:complete